jgi:hypothetical protein
MPDPVVPPGPKETGKKPDAGSSAERLQSVRFPERVTQFVWLAIGVGIALVLTSIGLDVLVPGSVTMKNLLLSSGLAIVLAAFGGQANYKSNGIIIAGSAAIAFIFFTYMEYSRKYDVPTFVRGYIANVRDGRSLVDVARQSHFLGRFPTGENQYEFVAFKRDMDQINDEQDVVVEIADASDPDNKDIFNVPFKCLAMWMGSGKNIGWYYDKAKGTLREFNAGGPHIAERKGEEGTSSVTLSKCSGPSLQTASVAPEPGFAVASLVVSTAFADDGTVITPTEQIPGLLAALQSEDADTRRVARSTLSLVQPQDVAILLQHVRENRGNYRAELGVSVALTEMLRRDKAIRDRIALSETDIEMLLDFATSPDRTLRIYAGEFLFDLGRPQVTKQALRRLESKPVNASPEWDNALYNLLFVSQDGWAGLSAEEKESMQPYLKGIDPELQTRPKTRSLRSLLE